MENIKTDIQKFVIVFVCILEVFNDVFEQFISTFNTFLEIKKCNKTNIMEFHFKARKDILIIFLCDPNDINVITYKEIQDFCIENNIEFKNQTNIEFITNLKNNFFDDLRGRIKSTKEQRLQLAKLFKFTCIYCKCYVKDKPFDPHDLEQMKIVIFKYYVIELEAERCSLDSLRAFTDEQYCGPGCCHTKCAQR